MRREISFEKSCREYVNSNGGYLLKMTGYKGIPDRILLVNGKVAFIEFKDLVGVQSPAQKVWGRVLEQEGFTYRVIRTKKEFIKLYQEVTGNENS